MAGSRTHWFAEPILTESTSELAPENRGRAKALRLKPGETLVLTNGLGLEMTCEVSSVESDRVSIRRQELTQRAKQPDRVVLQALTKHDPIEDALRLCTEFGASRFIPWQAARSVPRWSPAQSDRQQTRLSAIAREQSLLNHLAWFPVVEAPQAKVPKPVGIGILLTPEASLDFFDLFSEPGKRGELATSAVTFAVGPEGGISDGELQEFQATGYVPVSLGGVSYRSVSAASLALALLGALTSAPRMRGEIH